MSSAVEELVTYRLRQAQETLQEAEKLHQASLWRGSINRAYYAMFYAVLALAVLRQQATSKHSGVIAFFDREYVKTGIFERGLSRSLHQAFESRHRSDYGEIFEVSESEAKQCVLEAQSFVHTVKKYIESIPLK
jgi:uncharacterized protein (UPF0332 family)